LSTFRQDDWRLNIQLNLEKSAIVALSLVLFVFLLCPKFDKVKQEKVEIVFTSLNIEDIPVTRQSTRHQPPPKPSIPIPSDDELIPADLTIEETDINFNVASDLTGIGLLTGRPAIFQPRPIFEVIPEYPQALQKKGIQGMVKLHLHVDGSGKVVEAIILENTTNSSLCEQAAKAAALKCRYLPAKSAGKSIDVWITRTYTFGLQ
jgi:TonB family protein